MAVFTFEELLKPFEYLDISSLYNQYSLIIDAVIAFFIFFGIAKVTLGKRFEGRGGKAIIIGVGLALSTGFLLMEKNLNFSLRSFGPLAVAIILILVGFVFYNLLLSLGFNHTNSICLAYIIDYLSLKLVSPTIFDWIAQTAPFINGILGLGFLIAFIKLLFSLYPRSPLKSIYSKLPSKINIKANTENLDQEMNEEKEEEALIRSKVIKSIKKEIKDSDEMIETINEMIKVIEEYGTTPHGIREISNYLTKIRDKKHYAKVYFDYIIKIMEKVGSFDNEFYTSLKAEYETIQGKKQKRLKKKEIETEEKKQEIEEIVEKIEKLILQNTKQFTQFINYAVQNLRKRNPNESIKCLKESLKTEAKIKGLFEQMKELEGGIKKLTKRNFNFLRKEKKKFT